MHFIPGLGEAADAINVVICICRGDTVGAVLSAIGIVPVIGLLIAGPLKILLRAAGNADEIRSALKALSAIFGGMDKVVDGLKEALNTAIDMIKNIPDMITSLADNKLAQTALGNDGIKALIAMVAGLRTQIDGVVA